MRVASLVEKAHALLRAVETKRSFQRRPSLLLARSRGFHVLRMVELQGAAAGSLCGKSQGHCPQLDGETDQDPQKQLVPEGQSDPLCDTVLI